MPEMATLRSMTGFARVSHGATGVELEIEVRSVNHRYLDVTFKLPRCYSVLERELRGVFQRKHRRGRIEVAITRMDRGEGPPAGREHSEAFDSAVRSYTGACRSYGVGTEGLSVFLGHLVLREQVAVDESHVVNQDEVMLVIKGVEQASDALAAMREQEGEVLSMDISRRIERIGELRSEIASKAVGAPGRLKGALEDRLKGLAPEVRGDPQRLALEVALLADRVDISEELTRLEAHLGLFRGTMTGHADGVGRKLEFIVQEIGRELNTIGSKAQDAAVQASIVEAKSELERVREQVLNVE